MLSTSLNKTEICATPIPLVGITGGIGAGKSVVSRILRCLGYPVYDSDSRAKVLMENSPSVKEELIDTFGYKIFNINGNLERKRLADIVFSDIKALNKLNSIVHTAVIEDVLSWHDNICKSANYSCHNSEIGLADGVLKKVFVESAILFSSNLFNITNAIWVVEASKEIRLERASRRDNLPVQHINSRIKAQEEETMMRERAVKSNNFHIPVEILDNSGDVPLLPQILNLLAH